QLPWLASLLSLPADIRPTSLTPQQRKRRTLDAILWLLTSLAGKKPLLLIVEDAHWIDPTSRELIESVIERLPALRAVLIVTFRPPLSPPWIERANVLLQDLERLSRAESAAIVTDVTGDKALPPALVDQIIDRTDGVPLFVEELTKMVLGSELVEAKGGSYVLTSRRSLPTTLHDSLMARLDQLGASKQVAQIAAVIGREFSFDLLAAVSSLPADALKQTLGRLIKAGLILAPDELSQDGYAFKHTMMRDAAYECLLKRDRREIHAQVAARLKQRFADGAGAEPELLAHHFTEANLIPQGVEYWLLAARRALDRSANLEVM